MVALVEEHPVLAALLDEHVAESEGELLPYPPEGAPLLLRLGPILTRVAREIGILPCPS